MSGVRLQIVGSHGIIMDSESDENVLVPLEAGQRMVAFQALTDALALLSGLTPPGPSAATEGEADVPAEGSAPSQATPSSGDVVLLSERRAGRTDLA
jgi:hypothetical protein